MLLSKFHGAILEKKKTFPMVEATYLPTDRPTDRPTGVHQRTQVDDSYKYEYPSARVPGDRYSIFYRRRVLLKEISATAG